MTAREIVFAALLVLAAVAVVVGAAQLSAAVAWIVGGLLLAVWSWLVFGDIE